MSTSTSTTGTTSTKDTQKELRRRTSTFARDVRTFIRKTPRTIASMSDSRNLVKASGAVGASYIDADAAGSRTEFLSRIGDCRRESRRSNHWLTLLEGDLEERSEAMRQSLIGESTELERIFGAIIGKVVNKAKAAKGEQNV